MIEVRAEALPGHGSLQVGAVAERTQTSTASPRTPPTRRTTRSSIAVRSLAWRSRASAPHFVEEQRASVRRLEEPRLALPRIGEGPRLHPEELRLEQRPGNRRAIDRDKRTATSSARIVDGLCEQAFAGPGLATNQHGGLPPCRRLVAQEPPHLLAQRHNRRTFPEEVGKLGHGPI